MGHPEMHSRRKSPDSLEREGIMRFEAFLGMARTNLKDFVIISFMVKINELLEAE